MHLSICICKFDYRKSHFGFKGRTLILIASVPGHCLVSYVVASSVVTFVHKNYFMLSGRYMHMHIPKHEISNYSLTFLDLHKIYANIK